jgi:hypothetical protein
MTNSYKRGIGDVAGIVDIMGTGISRAVKNLMLSDADLEPEPKPDFTSSSTLNDIFAIVQQSISTKYSARHTTVTMES